jgi:hypothetical protein
MAEKLYRVYVQTLDHPHISEMIVSATDAESASKRALGHVKAANPEKGRSLKESQRNSVVVAVKEAGKNGCIVTNKIPTAVFEEIARSVEKPAETG